MNRANEMSLSPRHQIIPTGSSPLTIGTMAKKSPVLRYLLTESGWSMSAGQSMEATGRQRQLPILNPFTKPPACRFGRSRSVGVIPGCLQQAVFRRFHRRVTRLPFAAVDEWGLSRVMVRTKRRACFQYGEMPVTFNGLHLAIRSLSRLKGPLIRL